MVLTSLYSPLKPMKWILVASPPKLAGMWRSMLWTPLNLVTLRAVAAFTGTL